jgi:hypothetical protein
MVVGLRMGSIQDLVATWRAKGVRLEPPATESELAALEAAFGVKLPRDVREFYLEANGMSDLEYDDHEMSFWSISKILSDPGRSEGQDPNGAFCRFSTRLLVPVIPGPIRLGKSLP